MSPQINFYLMPNDILEIEEYIKKSGLLIIKDDSPTAQLCMLNSLTENDDLKKLLFLPKHEGKVVTWYVESQKFYAIDILFSPVIEFFHPYYDFAEKIMRTGRFYYTKGYYDANGVWVEKDAVFLKAADDLWRWFKKHFKNTKLMPPLWVTPRVADWVQNEGGKLLVN